MTQAAILYAPNEPLVVEEVLLPELCAGQVLVEIAYSGVCSTQLLEIGGQKGNVRYIPHTLGHEASGVVLAVGDGVAHVGPGDRVVLSWLKGAGLDVMGPTYRNRMGRRINAGAVATFLKRAIVSENRCTKIPNWFALDRAALLGCAVPTGAGSIFNSASEWTRTVVVIGVGGVGLNAVMAAASLRKTVIVAVDRKNDRLAQAVDLGATHGVWAGEENCEERILEITDGGGDLVLEASGNRDGMELAYRVTRLPGDCLLAGNIPVGEHISIDPFGLVLGKRLRGVVGGGAKPSPDFADYIRKNRQGELPFHRILGTEYRLDQINDAIRDLKSGFCVRPLINMSL